MAIEHVILSGDQLHESKGLSAASDKDYNVATTGANNWSTLLGIQRDTAANDTELDFINLSGYNTLVVTFQDVLPAASSVALLRVSTDNGSSFLETSIYYTGLNQDGTSAMSTDFTAINLINNSTTNYLTGKVVVSNFNQAAPSALYGHLSFTSGSNFTSAIAGIGIKGFINSAAAFNAIRIVQSTGNITSGTIIVEGIKG